jgi:predicted Zn-dependent protease
MVHRQFPAALGHIDALLLLEPGNAGFHNERGLILALTGRPAEEALDEFQAAVRLDPHANYARHNLARALLQKGDVSGAIREYEEDLRLDPGDAAARAAREAIQRAGAAAAPP